MLEGGIGDGGFGGKAGAGGKKTERTETIAEEDEFESTEGGRTGDVEDGAGGRLGTEKTMKSRKTNCRRSEKKGVSMEERNLRRKELSISGNEPGKDDDATTKEITNDHSAKMSEFNSEEINKSYEEFFKKKSKNTKASKKTAFTFNKPKKDENGDYDSLDKFDLDNISEASLTEPALTEQQEQDSLGRSQEFGQFFKKK